MNLFKLFSMINVGLFSGAPKSLVANTNAAILALACIFVKSVKKIKLLSLFGAKLQRVLNALVVVVFVCKELKIS